jgi:hypothetical protein
LTIGVSTLDRNSFFSKGEIAQLVEQWTENPCVPGSNPGLATISKPHQ